MKSKLRRSSDQNYVCFRPSKSLTSILSHFKAMSTWKCKKWKLNSLVLCFKSIQSMLSVFEFFSSFYNFISLSVPFITIYSLYSTPFSPQLHRNIFQLTATLIPQFILAISVEISPLLIKDLEVNIAPLNEAESFLFFFLTCLNWERQLSCSPE